MPSNWTTTDKGAIWFHGTAEPKKAAIEAGTREAHQIFLEQVTPRGRRFGSYPGLEDMTAAFGTDNAHLFEILVQDRPVKCYLDLDCEGEDDVLPEILDKLAAAYLTVLNMRLDPDTVRISCGSGQGDAASTYAGRQKQSYHVVVDDGFAFISVQHARAFVAHAFAGDDRVDKSPYSRNQSFKMIHQSKLNSSRVQRPQDGHSYRQHMVTVFSRPPAFYTVQAVQHAIERTTRLQVNVPEPVRTDTHSYVTDDVDIHSVPTLLSYFPNGPTKAAKQPFDVYLAIACICVNEAEPYSTFAKWASGYEAWSDPKCTRIWKSLSRRLDGYDIRTLRTMLNKARPSVLKDMQAKVIDQVMNPTLDFKAHNIDLIDYCEPILEPFIDQARAYKHVMLRSPMGSGKTHQILAVLRDLNPASVLVITPRQLFARSMSGTLREVLPDIVVYKDLPHSDRRQPRIICQLESLWTLDRSYDVVLFDESESILYQLCSPTVTEFDKVSSMLKKVVAAAKHVIHADAFISDRTLLTCVNMDPEASRCFIWNRWVPSGRRAFCAGAYKAGKTSIVQTARHLRGERNVFVSASKELAKQAAAVLQDSGPLQLITSETDDAIKKRLEDVDTFLAPVKHFIYTSSITVGTSFDRRDHFDNLLMYTSACSNNVRDSIQASMRVRHIAKDRLIYACYPRYHGTDRFDVTSRVRLRRMLEGREQHAEAYTQRIVESQPVWEKRKELEEWQKWIWVSAVQENNVSAFHHHDLLREYLQLCGYELMDSRPSVGEEVLAHIEAMEFNEIPDISAEEHGDISKLIQRGAASADDKMRYLKATFTYDIVPNARTLDIGLVSKMFRTYCRDQLGIERRLRNHRAEQVEFSSALNIWADNTAQKAEVVKQLCQQLGIENACDIGAQIERAVMEKSCATALEMKGHLAEVFDLRLREGNAKRGTLRRGLEVLNGCFHKYGFTEIVADGPRKRATVKGKKVNVAGYKVAEQAAYAGFSGAV